MAYFYWVMGLALPSFSLPSLKSSCPRMSTDELKKTPGANGFIRTLSILAAAAVVAAGWYKHNRAHPAAADRGLGGGGG